MVENHQLAVELRTVTKRFGDVVAVDKMSLPIGHGTFYSLLGPSGCGKTTTLRLIAGFEEPNEGTIYVSGEDVSGVPPYQRNVNTVFQHYAVFPHYNVWDNVAYGLKQKRVKKNELRQRVAEALEMVQLTEKERRRPRELSGGEQQRVALARALVLKPAVLLLDEPLGALDFKLRKQMQIELKKLQEQVGITFIYVTHDQEEALTMSDRIAVMDLGKILQVGSPDEIYERPNCRFVAHFIGESNFLEGTVQSCEEGVTQVGIGPVSVLATSDQRLPVGQSVTVMIRPEKVLLLPNTDQLSSHLLGQIERVVYSGATSQIQVRLQDSNLIEVRRQNVRSALDGFANIASEDDVVVTWQPEDALILPD